MPKRIPEHKETEKPVPEYSEETKPMPEVTETEKPLPEPGIPENMVQFGKKKIEIKPTKLKYQRDRTAAFYKLLQQVPLVELLIAVTDDPKLVTDNYDDIDSETVHRLLEIFCRLNYIKDEDGKKDQAQTTTP